MAYKQTQMKTQTKIAIGLGVAALGYYLYKSKKLSTLIPSLASKDTTPSKATDQIKTSTTSTNSLPTSQTVQNALNDLPDYGGGGGGVAQQPTTPSVPSTPIAPVTPVTPIFAPSEPSTPVFAPSEPIFAPSVPSAPIYSKTGCYTMSVTNMNPIGSPSGMIYLAYTDCCNGQVYNFAIEPQQTLDNIHTEVYTFNTPGLVESKVTEYVCTTKDGRVPKNIQEPEPPQYDEPIAQPIERIKTPVEPPFEYQPPRDPLPIFRDIPIFNLPIMEEPIMGEPIPIPRPIREKPIDAINPPPFMELPSQPIDCWMRPELCGWNLVPITKYEPPTNYISTGPYVYEPPFIKKAMPIYYEPTPIVKTMPIDDYNYDYAPRPIFKEPISYQEPIAMPISNIDYNTPTGGGDSSQFNWDKWMWNNDLYNEMPLKASRYNYNELT